MIDDLLAQVVPELVGHDRREDRQDLVHELVLEALRAVGFQHLLQQSTASLIVAVKLEAVEHLLLLFGEALLQEICSCLRRRVEISEVILNVNK